MHNYMWFRVAVQESVTRRVITWGELMPTYGNGKICYVEIPATDVDRSAAFYERAFGWSLRKRKPGTQE